MRVSLGTCLAESSNTASNTRRVQWLHRSQRRSRAALMTERYKQMPLFMDVHNIEGGVSAADAAGAHEADLATQAPYGVNYLRYWVDEEAGKIFCLVDAPDAEAANAVHRQAHGLPCTGRLTGCRRRDLPRQRARLGGRDHADGRRGPGRATIRRR